MKKILFALIFSWALVAITVLAQEQKGMPMGGGGMMEMMKSHMGEMQKSMGGMMEGHDMKEMEKMMDEGHMSSGEMENMSKMMGEMCGMMKQMLERMKMGTKKAQEK